jgi:hypothetical protein
MRKSNRRRSGPACLLAGWVVLWAGAGHGQEPAAPPDWVSELPSVQEIRKIQGANVDDTVAKQKATFWVLCEFIQTLTGQFMRNGPTHSPPTLSETRFQEYDREWSRKEGELARMYPGVSGKSVWIQQKYQDSYAFKKATLARFSPVYQRAYWASPRNQAALAAGQREQGTAVAAAHAEATSQALQPGMEGAGKAHIDVSVLGVKLGEPLRYPPCKDEMNGAALFSGLAGVGHGGSETCVGDASANMATGLMGFAQAIAGVKNPAALEGVQVVNVKLADAKCPMWMKAGGACFLLVSVKDGLALGASFMPGADASSRAAVEKQLRSKYAAPHQPTRGDEISCVTLKTGNTVQNAPILIWSVPGLHVTYTPAGNDCLRGKVEVETAYLYGLKTKGQAEQEQSETKI